MALRAKRPCNGPGCPKLTHVRFCDDCRVQGMASRNRARGSSSAQGYGGAWRQRRQTVLRRDPYCQMKACLNPAHHIDHIVAKRWGGTDDHSNLQGICAPCHHRKSRAEMGRRDCTDNAAVVTVVCGPPGSGKTTYVEERLQFGDLVIDWDKIMVAISGQPEYQRPRVLVPFVQSVRGLLVELIRGRSELQRAWVIATAPLPKERAQLREDLRAEVVVMETPTATCCARINADHRRAGTGAAAIQAVEEWWANYQSDERDCVVAA